MDRWKKREKHSCNFTSVKAITSPWRKHFYNFKSREDPTSRLIIKYDWSKIQPYGKYHGYLFITLLPFMLRSCLDFIKIVKVLCTLKRLYCKWTYISANYLKYSFLYIKLNKDLFFSSPCWAIKKDNLTKFSALKGFLQDNKAKSSNIIYHKFISTLCHFN